MFPQDKLKATHTIEVETGAKMVYYHLSVPRATTPRVEHVYAPFHVMAELDPTDGLRWMFNHPFSGEPVSVGVSHARPILRWCQIVIYEGAMLLNLQTQEIMKAPTRLGPIAAYTTHLPAYSPESITARATTYYFTQHSIAYSGMSFDFLPGHEIEEYDEAKHAQD